MPTVAEQQAKLIDLQTKATKSLAGEISQFEWKAANELTAEIRDIKSWLELNNASTQPAFNHGTKAVDLGTTPDGSVLVKGDQVVDEKSAIPTRAQKAIVDPTYRAAYKAYAIAHGDRDSMDLADRKALQEGSDGEGGFFVPAEIQDFVIMKKPAPTSLLGKVRQFNISKDSTILPKLLYPNDNLYTSPVRITNAGELPAVGAITQPTPQFGQAEIKMYTWMGSLPLSLDLTSDSFYNIEGLIGELLAQGAMQQKEKSITVGTGNDDALGVLTLAGGSVGNLVAIPTVSASAATAYAFADAVKALPSQIAPQYGEANYAYAFNKQNTYSYLLTQKDSNKRYLFGTGYQDSGLSVGKPTELAGEPFVFAQYMPNAASANIGGNQLTSGIPVMFGDWSGYFMVNRMGFTTKILDQTAYKQNQVEVVAKVRYGGQPAEEWKFVGISLAA